MEKKPLPLWNDLFQTAEPKKIPSQLRKLFQEEPLSYNAKFIKLFFAFNPTPTSHRFHEIMQLLAHEYNKTPDQITEFIENINAPKTVIYYVRLYAQLAKEHSDKPCLCSQFRAYTERNDAFLYAVEHKDETTALRLLHDGADPHQIVLVPSTCWSTPFFEIPLIMYVRMQKLTSLEAELKKVLKK